MQATSSQTALLELEQERKLIASAKIKSFYWLGAGLSIGLAGIFLRNGFVIPGIVAGLALFITGAVLLYKSLKRQEEYTFSFKHKVIHALLKEIDPDLSIDPDEGLSEQEFIHTGMFDREPDRMSSEDLICGNAGKTAFSFSEVHAEYKTTQQTKNGTSTTWHNIFKGVIFKADFNKNFRGATIVRPRDAGEAISEWFAKNVPLLSSSSEQLVQLENSDFCKKFVTYSSDQVEARYILTPAMMERLCELNERSEYTISVSFIGRLMYLAFPMDDNYFEPPLFKSLLTPDLLADDVNLVKFMYKIVEDLDLNTRIWGKD